MKDIGEIIVEFSADRGKDRIKYLNNLSLEELKLFTNHIKNMNGIFMDDGNKKLTLQEVILEKISEKRDQKIDEIIK